MGIYEEGEMEDEAWSMVQTKGNQFVVNGQSFYVIGFNTYWLMKFAVDQLTRGKVNEVFQQASSIGLTVCCTWAFNDGQGQALQKSPSIDDEEVFKNLLLSANSDNAVLKIANFGFARSLQPRGLAETLCGSPLYMAREIMQLQKQISGVLVPFIISLRQGKPHLQEAIKYMPYSLFTGNNLSRGIIEEKY